MRLSIVWQARALSASKLAAKLQKRQSRIEHETFLKKHAPESDKSLKMESMIAGAFLRNNADTFDSYKRHLDKINEINSNKLEKKTRSSAAGNMFPYQAENLTDIYEKSEQNESVESVENEPVIMGIARGFFVKGNAHCDEYTAGTTATIPEDEYNECPYIYYGKPGSIEHIELSQPNQETIPRKRKREVNPLQEDVEEDATAWRMDYGTDDPDFKVESHIPCSGCGAKLHCHDSALPGFVPVELLDATLKKHRRNRREQLNELCRRCYMLKHHNFLLNINVSPVNYAALMGHLKLVQEALILLVVDMTDIRGSIHRQLPHIIGGKKPMIVIGNKTDLLPPDAKSGYFKNFKDILQTEIEMAGFSEQFNILGTMLVSAKNGFGVEDLISLIYINWMTVKGSLRGDIYVVGCTNAGKSTLFNTFLQSDLCKVRAVDLVERVTTSVWPGTTLSLLKFPVMTPTTRRMELRRRRLLSHKAWIKKEVRFQQELFERTEDPKFLSLLGNVESTFRESELDSQPLSKEENEQLFEGKDITELREKRVKSLKLDALDFTGGQWGFDTPGTVSNDQILDLLTLDELIRVIPHSMILPRTIVCGVGDSLLIGGLGRIDVVEVLEDLERNTHGKPSVYLTVFASEQLPIYVVKTDSVKKFLYSRLGTEILGAPLGDEERLSKLPKMKHETFTILTQNRGFLKGSDDILLSSIGWVLVSSQFDITLKAYTPDGRGIGKRDPILPNAVYMKGPRIPGTQLYEIRVVPPDMEYRQQRNRRH